MKKISNNIISKSLLLFVFIAAQAQAWAADATDSDSKLSQAIAQPKFWIGVILFITCMVTATLMGRDNKEGKVQ